MQRSDLVQDPHFRVEVVNSTPDPNYTCWVGMHQCYAEGAAIDSPLLNNDKYDEDWFGEKVIEHALNHGHFSVCYDDQTEVLTKEGWKYWSDINHNDLLAAVDIHNNYSMTFEAPKDLVKLKHTGELCRFSNDSLDLNVTMDHNMAVELNTSKGFSSPQLIKAKDLLNRKYRVRKVVNYAGGRSENQSWLELAAFWLGDGFTKFTDTQVKFRLTKVRKVKYLKSLGFEVDDLSNGVYAVRDLEFISFLKNFIHSDSKILPWWVLDLDQLGFESLLKGFKNSDGTHYREGGLFTYHSTNLNILNTLQALITVKGLSGNIYPSNIYENEKHKTCYQLYISSKVYSKVGFNKSSKGHRDVIQYEGFVYCAKVSTGALLVRRRGKVAVSGNCEHPSISLNVINYPHSCMQQITRHRVGVSPSVQSGRYTSKRFIDLAEYLITSPSNADEVIEEVFYLRPVGRYLDRKGTKYNYSEEWRIEDLERCRNAVIQYSKDIKRGKSEEHARSLIPYDFRQNMILTFNMRSLMHVLGVRGLADTQLELQTLSHFMLEEFKEWSPIIGNWFEKKYYSKNRLAP